jgi:hypothetical protein
MANDWLLWKNADFGASPIKYYFFIPVQRFIPLKDGYDATTDTIVHHTWKTNCMAFQTPITISEVLDSILCQDYVLPAIQREFVWGPKQICRLFDSLMQGYPIGSFLFWKVDAEHSQDYTWYGFMKDFHSMTSQHCPVLHLPKKPVVAILDGQQRLTALNIGLRGSHAEKEPRKWWNNPDAFPRKYLYVNLLNFAPENDETLKYDFRFLTAERAQANRDGEVWYPVSKVLDFNDQYQVIETLQDLELGNNKEAGRILHKLYALVKTDRVIPYFEEKEQNLDKVLNIFIRVNSGGTVLSYSDLLLSIATSSWKELDARVVIHKLVDDLNSVRGGFQFSKDLVLKAGLMLSDITSVSFRVTNFNAQNMGLLEKNWKSVSSALRLAVNLLSDFGLSAQTLSADSVLIPVAYYVHKGQFDESYRTRGSHIEDRALLRGWVLRSLVKSGIWGSGLDSLLQSIRSAIQDHGQSGFPAIEVEAAMSRRGKSLRFSEDEIQDLLDSSYGEKRTLALLSLIYPHCDLRNIFHLDHIFPKSHFTHSRLKKAGVPEDQVENFHLNANRISNLQLLEGSANISKQDKMPLAWLGAHFPEEVVRMNYCTLHDLGSVPEQITEFEHFYQLRRERLAAKLRKLLTVVAEAESEE